MGAMGARAGRGGCSTRRRHWGNTWDYVVRDAGREAFGLKRPTLSEDEAPCRRRLLLTGVEARADSAQSSMGQADQIAKEVMASETTASSGACVVFEVPVEVPVGFLAPDGVMRVLDAPGLAHLPLPWRRLRLDATTEIKMPGDHTDRAALARAELRRQARFTRQLEQARDAPEKSPATHDARDYACWIVSAALPRWVTEDAAAGLLSLHSLGAGIWQLGPRPSDLLWIAANALPLEIEQIGRASCRERV